jgi:hypothetical protein
MTIDGWLALGGAVLMAAAALVHAVLVQGSWPNELPRAVGPGGMRTQPAEAMSRSKSSLAPATAGWLPAAAIALRVAAVAVLAAAAALEAVALGAWTPFDVRQVALGLALVAEGTGLVWAGVSDSRVGSPGIDLVGLGLAVVALWVRAGGQQLVCAERAPLFWLQWALVVPGVGVTAAAGGAGLGCLIRRAVAARRGVAWDAEPGGPLTLLDWAAGLALATLGGGLLAGALWSLRTYGSLASGDPRQGWMAATWLLAAASLLAERVRRGAALQAAVLAMLAAAAGIVGLLAGPDLLRLLGT